MADRDRDRDRPHQLQVHPQHRYNSGPGGNGLMADGRPSAAKVLAVMTMLPAGGILLCLAGITFVGTIIGLCLTTPLFIIFRPVLVLAALVVGLAVTGFLTSGVFGLMALSSLSRVANYIRQATGTSPEQTAEHAKRRLRTLPGTWARRRRRWASRCRARPKKLAAGSVEGGLKKNDGSIK